MHQIPALQRNLSQFILQYINAFIKIAPSTFPYCRIGHNDNAGNLLHQPTKHQLGRPGQKPGTLIAFNWLNTR